jgi:hypothetical protein
MSPMRAPGPAAAIPALNARSVALIIARLSGGFESPTMKLMAESAATPPWETAMLEAQSASLTAVQM